MITDLAYAQEIAAKISTLGTIEIKRMFGEAFIFLNHKPTILICDNTPYLKQVPALAPLLPDAELAAPYPGAKPWYMIDTSEEETLRQLVSAAWPQLDTSTKKTPSLQPGTEFPWKIGKPAARALISQGITELLQLTEYTEKELLALHGVGPRALAVLKAALQDVNLSLRQQ